MARKIFTALSFCLMILISSTIAPAANADQQTTLEKYVEELDNLNKNLLKLYDDINSGKTDQSTYEYSLNLLGDVSIFIGTTNDTVQSLSEGGNAATFQSLLEDAILNGFSLDVLEKLHGMGYSDADIEQMRKMLLEYNDYYHRISTQGFSAEEITKMQEEGYSNADIDLIRQKISERYVSPLNQEQMLESSKNEILQVQILLSVLSLKILDSLSKEQEKDKDEKVKHLREKEKEILTEIESLSSENKHVAVEHIKEKGKEIYKLTEELIKHGATVEEFGVDYFVGLQVHLGAETALNGDEDFGVNEIMAYRSVIEQLSGRPVMADFGGSSEKTVQTIKQPTIILQTQQQVGQVEESDETNNEAEIKVIVGHLNIDLSNILSSIMPFITMVISEVDINPFALINWIGGLIQKAFQLDIVEIVGFLRIGVNVTILIFIFMEPVGEEWPKEIIDKKNPYLEKIIVDEETINHIKNGAKDGSPCERSSHQAIVDNPQRIKEIVELAMKIFMSPDKTRFFYWFVDPTGKEWVVVVEKIGEKLGRIVTAYRVDCTIKCEGRNTDIITKWIKCEGNRQIWPRPLLW